MLLGSRSETPRSCSAIQPEGLRAQTIGGRRSAATETRSSTGLHRACPAYMSLVPTSAPTTRKQRRPRAMSPEAAASRLSFVTLEQFLQQLPPELEILHDGGSGGELLRWVEPSELDDP